MIDSDEPDTGDQAGLNPLDRLRRRYGVMRVNVVTALVCFTIFASVGVWLTTVYRLGPQARAMAADPAAAEAFINGLLVARLALVLALAVSVFLVFYFGFIRPLEQQRRRMKAALDEASDTNELDLLSYWYERRSKQLKVALEDNASLREEAEALRASEETDRRLLDSGLGFSADALVLVDRAGVVRGATAAALHLLGYHDYQLVGKSFLDTVELYDASKDHPEEYRVREWLDVTLQKASSIPEVGMFKLKDGHGKDHDLLATCLCVTDSSGHAVGGYIRLELADAGRRELPKAMSVSSRKDPMTGLLSKQVFESRCDELVDIARRQDDEHQFVFIAIDRLHDITAKFGHWAGEETLWHVAQAVSREVGAVGDGYRVSTDRFGVLVAFSKVDQVMDICHRLRLAVEAHEFSWQGEPFDTTISIAVVSLRPDGEGRRGLLTIANDLIKQIQADGGNDCRVYAASESLFERRRSDAEWSDWLFTRLDGGFGHLISQGIRPVLDDHADLRPWAEVLLRVEDDDGVWITPGTYLPAIERRAETTRVDLWVLARALELAKTTEGFLSDHAGFTINLFGASLDSPDFAKDVNRIISDSGVSPEHVCFEIDERFASAHVSTVRGFVEATRPTGCKIALDRCKASAGLGALRALPIDYVKISDAPDAGRPHRPCPSGLDQRCGPSAGRQDRGHRRRAGRLAAGTAATGRGLCPGRAREQDRPAYGLGLGRCQAAAPGRCCRPSLLPSACRTSRSDKSYCSVSRYASAR